MSTYQAILSLQAQASCLLVAFLPDDAKDKTQKKNKTRGTTINIDCDLIR